MDSRTFKELLERAEGNSLDFKRAQYDFTGKDNKEQNQKRAAFVKDIIAMFNTPREHASHIVLGVEKRPGGQPILHGVQVHPDDADLQAKCDGIVFPHPVFSYEPVTYDNKDFGLLTIPLDRSRGPCVPIRDFTHMLEKSRIYVRRGSQNAIADSIEQRSVHAWFQDTSPPPQDLRTGDEAWDTLVDALHGFEPSYYYILAVPRLDPEKHKSLRNLGAVDWASSSILTGTPTCLAF